MYHKECKIIVLIFILSVGTSKHGRKGSKTAENNGSKKEENSKVNFQAIKKIHAHLDDDHDGSVNLNESVGFMVDELQVHDKARHSVFHGNDTQISVEDLWTSWQQSDVYNWTTTDVVTWLQDTVGLAEYRENFEKLNITGQSLPRLAVEDVAFFQEIGIINVKHRKKVSLRAADAVLFGPPAPGRYNLIKDILLLVVILFATLACWYSLSQKKQAQKQLEKIVKDIEGLQQAEDDLQNLQEKLALAEMEQMESQKTKQEMERELLQEISSAKQEAERLHLERNKHKEEQIKMSLVEQELAEVRRALMKAEAEVDSLSLRSPQELQQWLLITYKKESKHVFAKKQSALKQMEEAKEAFDKIGKKRGRILGTFRLANDQSIDEVNEMIYRARTALDEVKNELQERQHRWRQIETLCGFQIATDGLLNLALDNMATKGRRSSVAQALAICANLGSMGSIPNPSVSGSEDENGGIANMSSFPRRRAGSGENNGNGTTPAAIRPHPKRASVRDRSGSNRRSGLFSDGDTGSDNESICSTHVNNISFEEAVDVSGHAFRPLSATYMNNGTDKRRSSPMVETIEENSFDKVYKRTKTEPFIANTMSARDILHSDKTSSDPAISGTKAISCSYSTPAFTDLVERPSKEGDTIMFTARSISDNDNLGSCGSIASTSRDSAIFAVEDDGDAASLRQGDLDTCSVKSSPLPKRGRSLKSRLKPRKKPEDDGDTDSLKKRTLLQRLKGK